MSNEYITTTCVCVEEGVFDRGVSYEGVDEQRVHLLVHGLHGDLETVETPESKRRERL